ncbi:MAG TPA: tetratricopeptide repeat protein [Gemmatimonadaceae bacterium]|nr:tetratricopeptide repeat protein [Gemmatimonadaceae bacterium]
MADQVHLWSDELARDPSSLVFLPLAETLRRNGQLDLARKVAIRGLERHPHNADAHDQLARIQADLGQLESAFDEWDMVLRLVPGHLGAIKGMAFVRFQQGKLDDAERLLMQVQEDGEHDEEDDISAAIATVRRSSGASVAQVPAELPSDPHLLFGDILAADQAAIMLDKDGLVLAGAYYTRDGRNVAQDIGAGLSGVSDEALRATKHIGIGAWRSVLFETEAATVTLAPAPSDGPAAGGLMVVAVAPATPLGQLRRLMDRCVSRALAWLGGATHA